MKSSLQCRVIAFGEAWLYVGSGMFKSVRSAVRAAYAPQTPCSESCSIRASKQTRTAITWRKSPVNGARRWKYCRAPGS